MWAFFGTTKEYPIIIGILQIVGAILLVFRKTKLFGALLLTPIFINIILINIFYKVPFGALLNALIYQSVFIFIIIQQRRKITKAFKLLTIDNNKAISVGTSIIKFVLSIILAIILFFAFQKGKYIKHSERKAELKKILQVSLFVSSFHFSNKL